MQQLFKRFWPFYNFLQMMLTKMLLTEILLDVTNEEIYYVAKDVHRKATKGMPVLCLFLIFFFKFLL